MRFTRIDPTDPEREFSLVVDVSQQEYSGVFRPNDPLGKATDFDTVPNCSPPLPALPDMVRQLNTDREFFGFIKRGERSGAPLDPRWFPYTCLSIAHTYTVAVRKAFRTLLPSPPNPSAMFDHLAGPGLRAPGERSSANGVETGFLSDNLPLEETS